MRGEEGLRPGGDVVPVMVGDDGAHVAHGFGAEDRRDRAAHREGQSAQVGGEETRGPGVARAVGIDGVGDDDGGDAVQFGAARDPRAVLAEFHGGRAAEVREPAGVSGVVVGRRGGEVGEEFADFVLVGDDEVEAGGELGEQPVAGQADDFERGDVETDPAAGGAGGGEDGVGQGAVEDDVALDVGEAAAGEVGGGDLVGGKREDRAEFGAHGALRVRGGEDEAAGVRMRAVFVALGVHAAGGEAGAVGVGGGGRDAGSVFS